MALLSQLIRTVAITGDTQRVNAWFADRQGGRWAEQTVRAAFPAQTGRPPTQPPPIGRRRRPSSRRSAAAASSPTRSSQELRTPSAGLIGDCVTRARPPLEVRR
jgi:hypothetical protein